MWQLNTLEANLKSIRQSSIKLRERRTRLMEIPKPSDDERTEIEELRVQINAHRKEERFLTSRIKQLQSK